MNKLEAQYKSVIHQLVQEILGLKKWRRDVTGDSPLFDIANEHTPATLATSQNNYDPGYYDVLRINAGADVSITGVTKGKKGRFLEFYNVSGFKITFPNESASSVAANRVINSSGEDIILFPTGRVRMYYDSTLSRWVIPDPPSWKGTYGMATRVSTSTGEQNIASGFGGDQILLDTIDSVIGDEYGFFDAPNNRIVIPVGMSGLFVCSFSGLWWSDPTAGTKRKIQILHSSGTFYQTAIPALANELIGQIVTVSVLCAPGDTLEFYAVQESGNPLDFKFIQVDFAKI